MRALHGVLETGAPSSPASAAKLQAPLPARESRAHLATLAAGGGGSAPGPRSGWLEWFPQPWHRLARPVRRPRDSRGRHSSRRRRLEKERASERERDQVAGDARAAAQPGDLPGDKGVTGRGDPKRGRGWCRKTLLGEEPPSRVWPWLLKQQPRGPFPARASPFREMRGAGAQEGGGPGRGAGTRQT